MRPKIDRRRLFSTVGTVALTDRSTINAYKAALLPARPFARPLDANHTQAESVPNFYQVQTFRRRNETRAISKSCLQPRDDFVDVHFVERDLCHRPNHEPDHFVKKTVPCNFDCDPRPASPNLSGPNRAHCVLFFFAAIGRERCEIMRADEFLSSRLQKIDI